MLLKGFKTARGEAAPRTNKDDFSMADPDSRQASAAPTGVPSPAQSGAFGFIPLPERDFFALNLDSTLLLPVDLPAGEEDGTVSSDADQSADEREKPDAGPAQPADGRTHDTDDQIATDTPGTAEAPEEKYLLANMAKLVEEVAAETGVAHRSAPSSPPAPAPLASAAHPDETKAGTFATDMSATLSELEKILEEVTGKDLHPITLPTPVSPPEPAAAPPGPPRRTPRPVPRAPRAPLPVTEYASPGEDGALLPLPDLDAIPPALEENPEPSGPSWDILWAAKPAREAQETPEPEEEERPFVSFIPPEDEEGPSPFDALFPATDSGGDTSASAGGLPTPEAVEAAPARSVDTRAEELPLETTTGAEPARAATRSSSQPDDAAIPAPGASRQTTSGTESDGNSKRRPHPATATIPAPTAAIPRPGPLFPTPGDEATRRTLTELRRLLAEMALKGDGLHRPVSRAAVKAPSAASGHSRVRRSPAVSAPLPAPRPIRRGDGQPTPLPTPISPAAPTAKPVQTPSSATTPPPEPSAPAAPARPMSPEKPAPAPSVPSPAGPEGPARAPETTPGPVTDETPSAASVDSPANASASGAAPDAVTAAPHAPPRSAPTSGTAPLAEPEAEAAPAPEKVTAAVKTPSSRLSRLAARLKRILRPQRSLPNPAPEISPTPAASVPAAGGSSPAPTTLPAEEADDAGGLIRRLRDMEAEHRARLRALTERPRGAIYPSREARRKLLNISLATDIPETPPRLAPSMPQPDPDGVESAETLRVLLDRPSVWRRLSAALRGRLADRLQDGAFRGGLRAVGGVLVLSAVVGALLYVALHPDQLDKILRVLH